MARSRSRSATADPPVLEIPVKYGNVNLGDETGRLGCSASRGNLTVAKADRNLVGKRLKVEDHGPRRRRAVRPAVHPPGRGGTSTSRPWPTSRASAWG
jgi:hypothetical protein